MSVPATPHQLCKRFQVSACAALAMHHRDSFWVSSPLAETACSFCSCASLPPPQSVCALEDALGSLHWFLYKYGNWVLLSVKMREERNIGAAEEDTYGSPFLPTTLPFLSPKGPCQGPPAEGRHDQRMQVSHALASTVRPRA